MAAPAWSRGWLPEDDNIGEPLSRPACAFAVLARFRDCGGRIAAAGICL